jgi:hypothetical protein
MTDSVLFTEINEGSNDTSHVANLKELLQEIDEDERGFIRKSGRHSISNTWAVWARQQETSLTGNN